MRAIAVAALAGVLLAGATLGIGLPSATGTAHASETFKKVIPENGLTVIIAENHSSPVINVRFYCKTGSIHEQEYLGAGITHYIEHTISDGSENRTLEEFEREVEEIGGGYNAYTTKDHACYFIETSTEHFDKALDLLSDMAMSAVFPQEEVDAQYGVITREINMGYDEPARRVYNLFGEAMFRVHPAKYPVIGHIQNFLQLTRDDLITYYERMYVPDNIVFVAVGDLDTEETYEKIRAAFADFERRPVEIPTLPEEPPQLGRQMLREERDLDMAYVLMGWHTVALSHPDLYPLDIMSHIMSEGRSSRLHQKLVEELGLVYNVTSWSHTPAYGAGVFAISMQMDPANVDAAIEAATREVYALKDKKVGKSEIEKAKKLKTAEFWFGRQDLESLASSLGRSEVTTGNPDFDELYASEIQHVTADQIRDVANKYFYDDNLGIAVLEPIGAPAEEGATATARAAAPAKAAPADVGEIEKHVLDNGLTVLLKENHTNPIVYVGSYSLAGARFERKNGLANFVANMMPRGTRKRSGEKISQTIDAMGAEYFCSANHTRIQSGLTVLTADFEDGLDLFADVLTDPKFDAGEMDKERPLIEAAILARSDNWTTDAMDRMLAELMPDHPYGRSPVGTKDSIAGITRDDLVSHQAAFVRPENTVLTVFGDIEPSEALSMVERAFRRWEPTGEARPSIYVEPERVAEKTVTSHHDRAQTVIFRGYRGMPYSSEDRYAMDVLDAITSGIYYPGGWLHTDLRGQGLVYVVHAYNWTGYDTGYFGVYAATFEEALDQAMEIIDGHLERIAQEEVTDDELKLAKQLCVVMDQTSKQTNQDQAQDAAIAELYGLGYDFTADYAERIRAITKDDVTRVAQKYLEEPVTVIRRPESSEGEGEHAATD
jgi:zinc protease